MKDELLLDSTGGVVRNDLPSVAKMERNTQMKRKLNLKMNIVKILVIVSVVYLDSSLHVTNVQFQRITFILDFQVNISSQRICIY